MNVGLQQSRFGGMLLTVGRLVRIKWFVGSEVINEAGYNNAFYHLDMTERFEIGLIVRELIFV